MPRQGLDRQGKKSCLMAPSRTRRGIMDVRVSRRRFLNVGGTAILAATQAIVATARQPTPMPLAGSFTDIGDVRVGHFTDTRRPTGCTAILFDKAATAGVDYNGSAPGESLGVMLQPVSPLDHI